MIPVEMPSMDSSMSEQNTILAQQLDRLDAMISAMKNQNAISQKLLQKTN
jgi:flagellar capping protein FliD